MDRQMLVIFFRSLKRNVYIRSITKIKDYHIRQNRNALSVHIYIITKRISQTIMEKSVGLKTGPKNEEEKHNNLKK